MSKVFFKPEIKAKPKIKWNDATSSKTYKEIVHNTDEKRMPPPLQQPKTWNNFVKEEGDRRGMHRDMHLDHCFLFQIMLLHKNELEVSSTFIVGQN